MFPAVFLFPLFAVVQPAKILTLIPFPSYSHQQPLLSVSIELARRGHHLTVITTNPPEEPLANFTLIDISSAYSQLPVYAKELGFTLEREWNSFLFVSKCPPLYEALCDYELGLPQVQDFIRNINTTYDLMIVEDLMYSSFGAGLAHKIGSPPVIGIHTLPPWFPTDWAMRVPINPAYMPEMCIGYTDEMDFFERVHNTIFYWWMLYQTEMRMIPKQERVLRKHFGTRPPSARDFEFNKSLILMPTNLTMTYPQPFPPNVIQIGPLHVKEPKPLSKDLQDWFDGAEDGVVYFSLGSNMKGTSLKVEKREAFVRAFAKFTKIHFVWKWESDEKIPGLSGNVLTRKWFPQQDILGHPNLRLFISQGGLQSSEEIIHYGVPVLGIPIVGDQKRNVWKLIKEGAAIGLEMDDVTTDSVYAAINRILYDEKDAFKANAMRLSRIAKDQLVPAMDTAVWWVEYVIRHKGAGHLRMGSFNLTWYQLWLFDVYGFLLIVFLVAGYTIYLTAKLFLYVLGTGRDVRKLTKKEKLWKNK